MCITKNGSSSPVASDRNAHGVTSIARKQEEEEHRIARQC